MELEDLKNMRVGDTLLLRCVINGFDKPDHQRPLSVSGLGANPAVGTWIHPRGIAEHIPKPAEPKEPGWAYGGLSVDILAVDDGWAWIKYRGSGNHASVQLVSLDRTDG